jgi:uncharacterized protein involved in exopolysaccharide biosynthesis
MYNSQENNELSLKEIILIFKNWFFLLKSKLNKILITIIFGSIVGFVYASLEKSTYTASLTFALDEEKGSSGNALSGLASNLGIDINNNAGGVFSESNLVELMKSKLIIKKTLLTRIKLNHQDLTLADLYLKINNYNKKYIFYDTKKKSQNFQKDSILDLIYKKVTSTSNFQIYNKVKSSSITTVEITSNSEIFSKLFCENLINQTSNYYVEIKSKKAKLNVSILQKQVDSIRMELNNSINGVAKLNDNIYNLNPAFNIKKTPTARRQIDVQANSAILSQLINNLELSKMTLLKETPLFQIIDTPTIPLKINKTSKIISILISALISFIFSTLVIIINHNYKKYISESE